MKLHRPARTASIIKRELNNLFLRELEFQGTIVTITAVEVSGDLLQAKVKVGIIPKEKNQEVMQTLEKKRKKLQHKLLKRTRLRNIPKLVFEIDNS